MRVAALIVLAALCGCAMQPTLRPVARLPADARADPRHYLVVTVHNPVIAPSRAASTARGYDFIGPYVAGGVARHDSSALANDYHLEEIAGWPIELLGVHCLVYAVAAGADPDAVAAALARDRRVESVQRLQGFATAAYNDPYAKLQTNIAEMAVPEAHALTRGAGVRVAVIDTGVDVRHPDLEPHGTRSRNFVDTDAGAFVADPHGTAVAGIIGAVPNNGVGIVGVAPDAELLVYKACWRAPAGGTAGVCNTFTLAQALAAAIEARADIVNLSLAGPSDPLLARLVRRGIERGIIFVGAAPQERGKRSFPVDIDGVIAVDMRESPAPAPGAVLAPGRDIMSLAPGGHYDFYSGSSLAAAQVSGMIALLKAQRRTLDGAEAARVLIESSGGAGSPNMCAALAAVLHGAACGATLSPAARLAPTGAGGAGRPPGGQGK